MPRRSRIQDRLVRRTKKGSRKLQKGLGTLALVSMVYANVGSYICRYTLKATTGFAGSITPELSGFGMHFACRRAYWHDTTC